MSLEKFPIDQAVAANGGPGPTILCPDCGRDATAQAAGFDARRYKEAGRAATNKFWVLVNCTGSCGRKLHKKDVQVALKPIPATAPAGPPEAAGRTKG